jgi:hypothetical protein
MLDTSLFIVVSLQHMLDLMNLMGYKNEKMWKMSY